MKYMILIYGDESQWAGELDEASMEPWNAYTQALVGAGAMVAGEALQPTTTATTVRVQNGETLTTDGPFAETKEQLGGYYLIDVESLDEALDWAAKCPAAGSGSIEVRPIQPIPVQAS